jgi:hypothetical protein
MKSFAALLMLLSLGAMGQPQTAQAQDIWRCGEGGRSYSTTPCSGGRIVASADTRPQADVQAALDLASREQVLARELQRERQAREAVAPGAGLAGIGPLHKTLKPRAAKPVRKPKHQPHRVGQPEDLETWRATGPSTRRARG